MRAGRLLHGTTHLVIHPQPMAVAAAMQAPNGSSHHMKMTKQNRSAPVMVNFTVVQFSPGGGTGGGGSDGAEAARRRGAVWRSTLSGWGTAQLRRGAREEAGQSECGVRPSSRFDPLASSPPAVAPTCEAGG